MPNKTIYVTAADLPLFDEAAKRAGGLSPAIATAIRHYLQTQGGAMTTPALDQIELDVTEGAATVRTRFRGVRVARLSQTYGPREVTYTIYRTAKDQYALYTVDRPNWQQWGQDPSMWDDPGTWSPTFYRSRDRALQVFPTAEELCAALPDDVAEAARTAMDAPAVRELDI